MKERRLLFVDTPRPATLTPLYLAFLAIALVVVLGLALAWVPGRLTSSDYRPVRDQGESSSRAQEGGSLIPSRVRDQPGRTRRM